MIGRASAMSFPCNGAFLALRYMKGCRAKGLPMKIQPLTDFGFGIRISAFKPSVAPPDSVQVIADLLEEHALLVVEEAFMDNAAFVEFAEGFGNPDEVHPERYRSEGNRYVKIQSNIKGYGVNNAGTYWHTDGIANEPPSSLTFLMCDEAPPVGGHTLFVDARASYEALPEDLKGNISGLEGLYAFRDIYERDLKLIGVDPLEHAEDAGQPENITRALVTQHPGSGRKALRLNERWLVSVVGAADEDGSGLLGELYSACVHSDYRYAHAWGAGEMLVWDNRSTMHKGTVPEPQFRKVSRRTTVSARE